MRAAITAVLPEPAPAITWTGPIGAVIAAHCSDVGSRSLSALRRRLRARGGGGCGGGGGGGWLHRREQVLALRPHRADDLEGTEPAVGVRARVVRLGGGACE